MGETRGVLETIRYRAIIEGMKNTERARAMVQMRAFQELSMQEAFSKYVFERIKTRNSSRLITFHGRYILIHGANLEDSLFVYPLWKSVNEPLEQLSSEIRAAVGDIAKGEKSNIYITYPKTRHLAKHITIKSIALEKMKKSYCLKLVPYACDLGRLLNMNKGEARQ